MSRKSWWFLISLLILASATLGKPQTKLTGYASHKRRRDASQSTNATSKLWLHHSHEYIRTIDNTTTIYLNDMRLLENATLLDDSWIQIEGLYGVYEIPSGQLWVWITKSHLAYDAPSPFRWHIRNVDELHLTYIWKKSITPEQQQEERRQVQLLRQALKEHAFYFCDRSIDSLVPDMTYNLQTCLQYSHTVPDSRFFWNEAALSTLNHTNAGRRILGEASIPLTSAFLGNQTVVINSNTTYEELLISRRGKFRAGTRFTKRGADQTGAVANYAETEQILFIVDRNRKLNSVCSHIQTRGSIPLRWSSPTDIKTYRPRVRIGTDPLAQARAVRQHLAGQALRYIIPSETDKHPSLVLVNLIDKKSDQGRLGRAFDSVLKAVLDVYSNSSDAIPGFNSKAIQHLWYDFHAEVKHGRWSRLSNLLNQVRPSALSQGYLLAVPTANSTEPFRVEKLQSGVLRTNCMDCLDRTNVVQSIFARYMLFQQLSDLKLLSPGQKTVFRKDMLSLPWNSGEVSHRLLWADNADAISRLYAGTPALKGDFTRTGKRTKRGALDDGLNSVQRYYLNNFLDADRQEGIDLMTGYQSFRLLDKSERPEDYDRSSKASLLYSPMSIQEAARQIFQGVATAKEDSESTFSRIKLKRKRSSTSLSAKKPIDFFWLPGDLQAHFQSSIENLPVIQRRFSSAQALKSIDRRSASNIPWWIDTQDGDIATSISSNSNIVAEVEKGAMANPGFVLGALVAGTQAPLTVATLVLGITGSVALSTASSSTTPP